MHCGYFTNRGLHNTTTGLDLLSKPLSHPQLSLLKHSNETLHGSGMMLVSVLLSSEPLAETWT